MSHFLYKISYISVLYILYVYMYIYIYTKIKKPKTRCVGVNIK